MNWAKLISYVLVEVGESPTIRHLLFRKDTRKAIVLERGGIYALVESAIEADVLLARRDPDKLWKQVTG